MVCKGTEYNIWFYNWMARLICNYFDHMNNIMLAHYYIIQWDLHYVIVLCRFLILKEWLWLRKKGVEFYWYDYMFRFHILFLFSTSVSYYGIWGMLHLQSAYHHVFIPYSLSWRSRVPAQYSIRSLMYTGRLHILLLI